MNNNIIRDGFILGFNGRENIYDIESYGTWAYKKGASYRDSYSLFCPDCSAESAFEDFVLMQSSKIYNKINSETVFSVSEMLEKPAELVFSQQFSIN